MYAKISIMVLLLIVSVRGQGTNRTDVGCRPMKILCTCEDKETSKIVPEFIFASVIEGMPGEKAKCSYTDPEEVCENINCQFNGNNTGISALDRFDDDAYVKVFVIPKGFLGKDISATGRKSCRVPIFRYATAKCWKWPSSVLCEIQCIYGHAIPTTDNRTLTKVHFHCSSTKNKWEPHEFVDCSPYWNCKPRLISSGSLTCREPSDKPASCDISCFENYGYEAVPLKTYVCTDKNYGDQIPHCAALDENEKLIDEM